MIRRLLVAWALTLVGARADADDLRWPLEFDDGLSASFGELRGDRLHTGVDLRTRGEVGHPVHAVADGRVVRMQERWRGYGLAVYIEHPGGLVTVYGHLDRVLPALEAELASQRKARRSRWADDLSLSRPIAVKRGEVFAWAGESGSGMPHLHFETRRGMGTPVDPFSVGLAQPADPEPPVVEQLIVEPAGPGATVDGRRAAVAYDVVGADGQYSIDRPIRLAGPVRLLLRAFDRVGSDNHAGIGGLSAYLDTDLLHEVAFPSIPFTANQTAGLLLDLGRSHLSPSFYTYRLVGVPGGSTLHARAQVEGAVTLSPGHHRLTVDLRDAVTAIAKPRSRLTVDILAEPTVTVSVSSAGSRDVEVEAIDLEPLGDLLRLVARTGPLGATTAAPVIEVDGEVVPMVARGPREWDAELKPTRGPLVASGGGATRRFAVDRAEPGRATTIQLGGFRLSLSAKALWGPVTIVAREVVAIVPDGLRLRAEAVALSPDGHPFRDAGSVTFDITGDPRSGLYQLDTTDGSWSAVDFGTTAEVRRLGTYALIDDLANPVVDAIRTEPAVLTAASVTRVVAKVSDLGAGIPEHGVRIRIGGQDLDVLYDPDRGEAAASWGATPGEHQLLVRVSDWVGNTSERTATLTVP